jgi:hypothetical protein
MRRYAVLIGGVAMLSLIFSAKPASADHVLLPGQWLVPGQFLLSNGYKFWMQTDGNLVLYTSTNRVLWASNTGGTSVDRVIMQTDGNLVIYSTAGPYLWASNTGGGGLNANSYLIDQTDGNVVIYRANGTSSWATHTGNANNTESYGNGDCWRVGTPATCRNTWSGRSMPIYFRAIDQFSDLRPSWMTGAQAAVNAWNNAPGPQYYSFTPRSNDTWVYLSDSYTGSNGIGPNTRGITWNCRQGVPCDRLIPADESLIAQWTDVYFNRALLDGNSNESIQRTFAHESGHAMLLRHNTADSTSLMTDTFNPSYRVPNGNDIGAYPGCAGGGFGIRCIYGDGN